MIRRVVMGLALLLILCCSTRISGRAGSASRPEIDYMPTRAQSEADHKEGAASTASQAAAVLRVLYHGGRVEVAPKAYLVVYGSQWKNNDPDKEVVTLVQFLSGLEGPTDRWSNTLTQYCQGAPAGAHSCGPRTTKIVHPTVSPLFPNVFFDDATPAPAVPSDSDFEAETRRAAEHFGNKTSTLNLNKIYIIATAKGYNADGLGSDFCAWHSYAPSRFGNLAFVNLPYVSQAGSNCGSGFVNKPGRDDGITMVAGHEFAEAATDPFPGGWFDNSSDENEIADKCSWLIPGLPGGAANVTFPTGTFPVQSLWSNNFGTAGGCVISYTSAAKQQG